MFDVDYSDVVLIFDFDPHDNRFSISRLSELLAYFNESTDEGKLYINYPMVEACKHFVGDDDFDFLTREISVSDVAQYKRIVGDESRFQSFERDFRGAKLDRIIALTALKAALFENAQHFGRGELKEIRLVNQQDLLDYEWRCISNDEMISVLGSCLLFVIDYSTSLGAIESEYGRYASILRAPGSAVLKG